MEIYLIHTPYHLILSILNGCMEKESAVFLMDDSGNLEWYGRDEISSFFKQRLFYLSLGSKGVVEKFFNKNKFFSRMVNSPINKLAVRIKKLKPKRVYVFADYQPEVQNILHGMHDVHVTYIEDGSAPYNSHKITNQKNSYFQKILFGLKYERVSVFGTSKLIRDSLFTFPELVRDENKIKPYRKIETNNFRSLNKFANLYDIPKGFLEESRDISIYLLPPYVDEQLLAVYQKLILKDLEGDVRPIVKRHPSSKKFSNFSDGCWEIDQFIPTEIILLLLPNVKKIFSYPSTSLLVAGIFNKVEANCIVKNENEVDLFFINNLQSVGVNLIRLE